MRERANPDAWIVDFTNPVGIVTRALLQAGHRRGLCNVAIGFQRRLPRRSASAPTTSRSGMWASTTSRGSAAWSSTARTGWPGMLAEHLGDLAEEVELAPALLAQLGMVPSYYLRYYYAHDEVLAEQLREPTRAEAVKAIEDELLALTADPSVDTKPEALERRGGAFYSEAAVELLDAMRGTAARHAW